MIQFQASILLKHHEKDSYFIEPIQKLFENLGEISKPNKSSIFKFRVYKTNDLVNVFIPHFDKYKLITKKKQFYLC